MEKIYNGVAEDSPTVCQMESTCHHSIFSQFLKTNESFLFLIKAKSFCYILNPLFAKFA